MWALTAKKLQSYLGEHQELGVRFLVNLHFGRNWGMTVKYVWMVLGLVPAALFVTGFITWYARVVRRRNAEVAMAGRAGEPALASLAEDGVHN